MTESPPAKRTLVIGYGNVYRRDDGVGYAVVCALRQGLGQPNLEPEDDGLDDLGHTLDTIVVHQLVPELADMLSRYDLVVFVDAHVGHVLQDVYEEQLDVCYRTPFISHHMHPCTLLALAHQMNNRKPAGVLYSLRGHDFEFGEGLSADTSPLVPVVVGRILALVQS